MKLRVHSILPPFDCDKTNVYSGNQLVSCNDYYYITPMIEILIRWIVSIIVTGNLSLITMSLLNCNPENLQGIITEIKIVSGMG